MIKVFDIKTMKNISATIIEGKEFFSNPKKV